MDQFLSPFSPSLYIASLTQDTHALDTFQTAHAHLTAIHNSLLSQLTLRNETQKREREGTRRRRREVEEAIDVNISSMRLGEETDWKGKRMWRNRSKI